MKTRRFCPKCGRPVLKSHNDKHYNNYSFQCFSCDEDFFKTEVLRKKDLVQVRLLQHTTLRYELETGTHNYSIYKPYPRHNV